MRDKKSRAFCGTIKSNVIVCYPLQIISGMFRYSPNLVLNVRWVSAANIPILLTFLQVSVERVIICNISQQFPTVEKSQTSHLPRQMYAWKWLSLVELTGVDGDSTIDEIAPYFSYRLPFALCRNFPRLWSRASPWCRVTWKVWSKALGHLKVKLHYGNEFFHRSSSVS